MALTAVSNLIRPLLGSLAEPGERRMQRAQSSKAAQLPLSRATCPTASPQVCPARRTTGTGRGGVPGRAAGGGHWLPLLADVRRRWRGAVACFVTCQKRHGKRRVGLGARREPRQHARRWPCRCASCRMLRTFPLSCCLSANALRVPPGLGKSHAAHSQSRKSEARKSWQTFRASGVLSTTT